MNLLRLLLVSLLMVLAGCATNNQQARSPAGPQIAADTSRTIDLTHPPKDMWDRIRRGYAIPNLRTDLVDYWTNYYANNARSVTVMSERASKYLYHIVDELERRGMPTELALLPFVESAYNPEAYSKAHASGLWQFVPGTAKDFNLEQNWWLDQRRDPVASTNAALDYLQYLYELQGDWYLALASYNWGQGSVLRAVDKNTKEGLGTDYLALRMPDETRNYVPKLQAIKNIITNPQQYNIALPLVQNEPYFTAIAHSQQIDLEVAAELAEMSLDDFRFLNPAYNRSTTPTTNVTLLLPANKADIFQENIKRYQGRLSKWDIYNPKPGETYATIAKRYGMSLSQLRSINGISAKQSTVKATQTLLVAAQDAIQADPLGTQIAALNETPALPTTITPTAAERSRATTQANTAATRSHTVKKGETLYSIARRYNTTVSTLQQLNNLKSSRLAPGARLRLPGPTRG
ncbi:MAG TPA: LysM peptidoglycan-binding domain-containing protein [Paenalcaligenes hominis]|uniref:LysM peptidoglycan-binding domain-containing protein n=1 Tax=Paenalcaligenes hominis TaxID=643674 RepID=A0A9D2VGP5_9BURK|nr:LysM peptidoglycan-binding domain-containing protein [Paenalcaligenes hominis]NJB65704.1 membrane-bound lytic murein transglycosylase D [Paenalcaligenes hominis]GGE63689.1 lytic transglycosylase [Paenalcaligenes hominis]HJH24371.1 LysM peptidoglycan-binding domain-containing protein [Paenalcaligenes hominis]